MNQLNHIPAESFNTGGMDVRVYNRKLADGQNWAVMDYKGGSLLGVVGKDGQRYFVPYTEEGGKVVYTVPKPVE